MIRKPVKLLLVCLLTLLLVQCNGDHSNSNHEGKNASESKPLFEKKEASHTGIEFFNDIVEDENSNIFKYDYMYNGGGVAIADIDNDGLVDLYFTGNMRNNRLYKNLGNFKFKDITSSAKVTDSKGSWSTGASFVDINADGYQDIYVCRSFDSGIRGIQRNQLYINNGDLTFTERAKEYGLDDAGFSTQASYFDYDQDGDIDVFVANHGVDFHRSDPTIRHNKWLDPQHFESNHLYRNNGNNTFTDVTVQAGLLSYDYTLGVITADINGDGLPDIYTSNDYEHPDKYYINSGDGTFKESLKEHFKHTSYFSMGVDFADINNDDLSDLVAVDMVAEDNYRQKTMMSSMNPKQFWESVSKGYYYQYMRNSLQLNNGDGNFSEIGQLSGISKTDWSWAVLLADFDLDGWQDMYVANGFYRDTRNVDYRKYYEKNYGTLQTLSNQQIQDILSKIPRQKITNYYFQNKGDLKFENQSFKAGIKEPSYSNGASYADLDNDGDLDLVVNNLSDKAFVYQNNSVENGGKNYLQIRLMGDSKNRNGIGAKVTIRNKGKVQTRQHIISRGYQSSVSHVLHFGLGEINKVEELTIKWASGKTQVIKNVQANQVLKLREKDALELAKPLTKKVQAIFTTIPDSLGINYKHQENEFDDYKKEILLPHKMSQMGPKLSIGDVNGDQLDDVFIGAAAGSSGQLYIQQAEGTFVNKTPKSLSADKAHEDIGSLFFDADGDGDQDLYVVSGGNEFAQNSALLSDRLYLNDGLGNFSKSTNLLPKSMVSGSCVVAADYDKDGDLDLFVGGRLIPGQYLFPAKSSILQNNKGVFKDVTQTVAPSLEKAGMVSAALWSDFDQDGLTDLIVTGEWMPIRLLRNTGEKFEELTKEWGLDSTNGWWNVIQECDLNKDGKPDYVVGNLGQNYKYKASKETPFPVYVTDFDANGTQDIVLGYSNQGTYYPVRGKECTSQQIPKIKQQFSNYEAFGKATLNDIYGDKLDSALHRNVFEFSSVVLENKGSKFSIQPLPIEAQISTVQGIIIEDFTGDNQVDILLTGNLFVSEVETGRADASNGLLLAGNGSFEFSAISAKESGFFTPYDARDLQLVKNANQEPIIIVSNNDASIQLFGVARK